MFDNTEIPRGKGGGGGGGGAGVRGRKRDNISKTISLISENNLGLKIKVK